MRTKMIEKIRNKEIRARAGAANVLLSENMREERLRLLGHVEIRTEEDIIMRTWNMEVRHRHIG